MRGIAFHIGEWQFVSVVFKQQVAGDGIAVTLDLRVVVHEAGGTALFRLLQTHDFLIAFQLRLIAGHLVAEQLVDQTDIKRLQMLAVLLDQRIARHFADTDQAFGDLIDISPNELPKSRRLPFTRHLRGDTGGDLGDASITADGVVLGRDLGIAKVEEKELVRASGA